MENLGCAWKIIYTCPVKDHGGSRNRAFQSMILLARLLAESGPGQSVTNNPRLDCSGFLNQFDSDAVSIAEINLLTALDGPLINRRNFTDWEHIKCRGGFDERFDPCNVECEMGKTDITGPWHHG